MTEAMRRYRELERQLWFVRWRNAGDESADEDRVLEAMEAAWHGLDGCERDALNQEGARCWPLEPGGWVPTLAEAASRMTPEQLTYDGFASVDETIEQNSTARAA